MPRRDDTDGADRLADLEAFVREVVHIGETLIILGDSWGGGPGGAIAEYGRQLEQRARALRTVEIED